MVKQFKGWMVRCDTRLSIRFSVVDSVVFNFKISLRPQRIIQYKSLSTFEVVQESLLHCLLNFIVECNIAYLAIQLIFVAYALIAFKRPVFPDQA
jgi:hypothetical protein